MLVPCTAATFVVASHIFDVQLQCPEKVTIHELICVLTLYCTCMTYDLSQQIILDYHFNEFDEH